MQMNSRSVKITIKSPATVCAHAIKIVWLFQEHAWNFDFALGALTFILMNVRWKERKEKQKGKLEDGHYYGAPVVESPMIDSRFNQHHCLSLQCLWNWCLHPHMTRVGSVLLFCCVRNLFTIFINQKPFWRILTSNFAPFANNFQHWGHGTHSLQKFLNNFCQPGNINFCARIVNVRIKINKNTIGLVPCKQFPRSNVKYDYMLQARSVSQMSLGMNYEWMGLVRGVFCVVPRQVIIYF